MEKLKAAVDKFQQRSEALNKEDAAVEQDLNKWTV